MAVDRGRLKVGPATAVAPSSCTAHQLDEFLNTLMEYISILAVRPESIDGQNSPVR